jgi:hypothetical protein
LGEVGAQRRVRGYGLSSGSAPSPNLLRMSSGLIGNKTDRIDG